MRQHPGEEGVSELVGAMLLIGLTVIGVALVGIVFLSSPQPDAIPRVSIAAGNMSGKLILTHEGGDPLRAGEYRIYVENESGLVDRTDAFTGLKDGAWSVGGNLIYNGSTPERVIVTAVSGGTETVLAEPEFRGGNGRFSPDPVGPGVAPVSPGTPPGPVTPPSSSVIITSPLIQNPIWNNDINYTATVDKNATRVDLIIYDFNISSENHNNKVAVFKMENTTPETYYQKFKITSNTVQKGNYAAITVIAYNGSKTIGYDTIVVKAETNQDSL